MPKLGYVMDALNYKLELISEQKSVHLKDLYIEKSV